MKVNLPTTIELPPEVVWAEVQTAPLMLHISWPLVRFVPASKEPLDSYKPGGRYLIKLRLFGFLPFGSQWIVPSLHEPEDGTWPKRIRDDGHSAIIRKWDHWITITPNPDGTTCYRDEVDISAGILTPIVWAFAHLFYSHRQRRWRALARTLHARHLIKHEMTDFEKACSSGDTGAAWRALENAHIVSQPYLGPHLASHRAMLGYALKLRAWREVRGQLVRLGLAPLGALTGQIPMGNTGRSNVSAFQPMPIRDELRRAIEGEQPE